MEFSHNQNKQPFIAKTGLSPCSLRILKNMITNFDNPSNPFYDNFTSSDIDCRSILSSSQNLYNSESDINCRTDFGLSKSGENSQNTALGSITKSQSKNKTTKQKNAETLDNTDTERKGLWQLKNHSAKLLPAERVKSCLCSRCKPDELVGVKVKQSVDIKNNSTKSKATFTNLFRCDSVWTCPLCGQRILAQRATEIERAIEQQLANGRSIFMLTLTHSHANLENLKDKLRKIGKALSRFFGDRAVKQVFEEFGMMGHIKALEITHSFLNGWHPHNHILMFSELAPEAFKHQRLAVTFDKNGFIQLVTFKREKMLMKRNQEHLITDVTIEEFIKHYWRKCCLAVGLGEPSYERGATLQNAEKAKSYLTKFKTSQEIVGAGKTAKVGSRNQWQLLADSLNGNKQAGILFQEYANAFKGQKQLVWSRGLKDLFDIEQIDDSECEESPDMTGNSNVIVSEEIAYFQIEQWYFIRKNNLQPDVLDYAERHGIGKLRELIEKIPITALPVQDEQQGQKSLPT